jgi:hypothetical protein
MHVGGLSSAPIRAVRILVRKTDPRGRVSALDASSVTGQTLALLIHALLERVELPSLPLKLAAAAPALDELQPVKAAEARVTAMVPGSGNIRADRFDHGASGGTACARRSHRAHRRDRD